MSSFTFKAPQKHDDIESSASSPSFFVRTVSEINSDSDAQSLISSLSQSLVKNHSFLAITEQDVFDRCYSVSLCAKRISPKNFKTFTVGVLGKAFARLLNALSLSTASATLGAGVQVGALASSLSVDLSLC